MAEVILNDPIAFRRCILFEFLSGKKMFTCYKNMCYKLNQDVDYIEFEFFYLRFANGNFDLSYDRRLEPKTRTFTDMPIHILDKIFGNLETKDRFRVNHVCQSLRALHKNPDLKTINIGLACSFAIIHFEDRLNFYNSGEYYTYEDIMHETKSDKKYDDTKNYMEVALRDIASFLSIKNLELEKFEVSFSKNHAEEFESTLKSLERKIHAKSARIRTKRAISVLPYLEAGTLQRIHMEFPKFLSCSERVEDAKTRIGQILQLEQCKKAEMLEFEFHIPDLNLFPTESFLQCPRLTLQLCCYSIVTERFMQLLQTILKSTVLELFYFKSQWEIDFEPIKTQLALLTNEVPDYANVRHFSIPDSNEFFEIEFNEEEIRIERKH